MTDISEDGKRFLTELFKQTGGDTAATVSMFHIGESAGFDRSRASAVGEELIGWDLVEVRTLSGGVAISESGIAEAKRLGSAGGAPDGDHFRLGTEALLSRVDQEAVDRIASKLKSRVDDLKLGYEGIAELVADLKSLDAQLSSPRPKTGVVREIFRSILRVLEKAGAEPEAGEIRDLLGNGG